MEHQVLLVLRELLDPLGQTVNLETPVPLVPQGVSERRATMEHPETLALLEMLETMELRERPEPRVLLE